MKALFILHEGIFIYGANRSISGVLKNLEYDFDLLICRSFTKQVNETELRELFGNHLKNVFVCWIPRYRCQFYDKVSVFSECSHIVNNVLAYFFSGKRRNIIKRGNYDYVHLNSLVLYPVIDHNARYVVHAREIINPEYRRRKKFYQALEKAEGIIYIDEATRLPVEKNITIQNSLVLNNPFDMRHIRNTDAEESLKKYGLSNDFTVFAMLGQVGDNKGSKFVIHSFMSHHNQNSRLLIVGNHNHAYGRECEKMTEKDERIIYCGELKDTSGIYRICDYIIRGENQFCIGRTIFEGLYSGAGVIIPGFKKDLKKMPDEKNFSDKIYLYEPGNKNALSGVIEKCSHKKQLNREFKSNITEYMEQYHGFIKNIVVSKGD